MSAKKMLLRTLVVSADAPDFTMRLQGSVGLYVEAARLVEERRTPFFGRRTEFFLLKREVVRLVKCGRLPKSGLHYRAQTRTMERGVLFYYDINSSYPASMLKAGGYTVATSPASMLKDAP